MASLIQYVGNRSPSLQDTILVDDVAFDLTGSTVKLRMRLESSSTLKVDATATIVTASTTLTGDHALPISTIVVASTASFPENGWLLVGSSDKVQYTGKTDTSFLGCRFGSGTVSGGATVALIGEVRYDWASADVDTAGDYVFWWQITLPSAKTQDTPEFPLSIIAHAPGDVDYITPELLKATLQLDGTNYADLDIQRAISAASRGIDWECGRRFYPDADANQVRYYEPIDAYTIAIDDLITLTTLETDQEGDGTFEQSWTVNSDFVLEPLNAAAEGWPYMRICLNSANASQGFPVGYVRSVKVTGKFGWSEVPDAIVQATGLVAAKLLKRSREDPGGAGEALALGGAAVRLAGPDPVVRGLIAPYMRHRPGF